MQELINNSKVLSAITPTAGAAGSTAIDGSTIDTADFRGVLFVVHFGAIVTGAETSIKLEHGDASDLSDATDVAGTAQTVADDKDNTVFYIDLNRPTKRYVRLVVSRATQNATLAAVALLYNPADAPRAQTATGEQFTSPASGTA